VKPSDLFIGNIITVLARQLKIVEYSDEFTRKSLESQKEQTLALIKPDAYNHIGHVLSAVTTAGFIIANLRMVRVGQDEAREMMAIQRPEGDELSQDDIAHLQADVSVAIELVGTNAASKWQQLMGPRNPVEAKGTSPRTIRALYGTDEVRNAVYGSANASVAQQELDLFFKRNWPTTALFNNCTMCVIRPHAFAASGEIVTRILEENFEISAMRVWMLDKAAAEEFTEVYKGVLPEYHDVVSQLTSGPCLAMEVRQEDAVSSFRQLAGPLDPEVAKHLRPNTLRAKHGMDRVRNAVHATDLQEDGLLEVEYFFNILYNRA
jgi:nucleoside-diphosphate kinase